MGFPTEEAECRAFWTWVVLHERLYPELALMYHVPNGGHRFKSTAGKLKAMGARPGVFDYCLPIASGPHHSLYVEMKRRHGGVVSPEQKKWAYEAAKAGNLCEICRGADEAIHVVENYLRRR